VTGLLQLLHPFWKLGTTLNILAVIPTLTDGVAGIEISPLTRSYKFPSPILRYFLPLSPFPPHRLRDRPFNQATASLKMPGLITLAREREIAIEERVINLVAMKIRLNGKGAKTIAT